MLSIHELDAYYGDFQALFALSLTIQQGESVAIIGANGAGKSTLLKAISGALPVRHGAIRLREHSLGHDNAAQVVRKGIALVPEGRRMFPSLSVEENLQIGAYARRPGPWNLGRVYTMFPARGAAPAERDVPERWRAADGRHRARAHVEPLHADVR